MGAKLLAEDDEGHTALHLAAMGGHLRVLLMLTVEGGLDLLSKASGAGTTALEYATLHGRTDAQKQLMHARKDACRKRAVEMAALYDEGQAPVTRAEYIHIMYSILLSIPAKSTKEPATDKELRGPKTTADRFAIEPTDLICGEFDHAAKGFYKLLNVSEDEVFRRRGLDSVAAIEEEVRAFGDSDVSEQLHYILQLPASLKECPNGLRDKGHEGMVLQDFVEHEHSKTADLNKAEVVALRLYTTSAFRHINNPLRDQARISRGEPHPLPVTVMLITSGIKKLRAIDATGDAATQSVVLWRGMKNVRPTDKFVDKGGTEVCICLLECMGTLLWVHYSDDDIHRLMQVLTSATNDIYMSTHHTLMMPGCHIHSNTCTHIHTHTYYDASCAHVDDMQTHVPTHA